MEIFYFKCSTVDVLLKPYVFILWNLHSSIELL